MLTHGQDRSGNNQTRDRFIASLIPHLRLRGLLFLVPDGGDAAASWTIRSIEATGGSQSSALVRGVQSFDIGWPRP
jgi:hypothetical protein